jgi:hypothetical protein
MDPGHRASPDAWRHPLEGVVMPKTRRRYDSEFREGAVRIVRETGKPIAQVARDLGGSGTTSSTAGTAPIGCPAGTAPTSWGESGTADRCDGGHGLDRSGPGCEKLILVP